MKKSTVDKYKLFVLINLFVLALLNMPEESRLNGNQTSVQSRSIHDVAVTRVSNVQPPM